MLLESISILYCLHLRTICYNNETTIVLPSLIEEKKILDFLPQVI